MVSSTPRLSEFARKFTFPSTIERTVWPRVEARGQTLGLRFDWWQSQLGTVCLGYDARGRYAATVGGVGMSIPRQVGKTYFVLAMLTVMCVLFPGLQVVWTAHHLRTSTKTFTALRGICRRPKVAKHVRAMRSANGEQQVEFHNGSMIMFGARAQGFGRGFDEIDVEVFDEAQILDTKALEDMIAATNQARHPHGALLFFMGTPPRPTDPSDAFSLRRADAWSGQSDDAIWLEIGADPKSSPNDQSQWPMMNPSFPLRTPLESLLRLKKNLGDEDSWNREGRGVWDEDAEKMIGLTAWQAMSSETAVRGDVLALSVAISPDRKWASIGSASTGKGTDNVHLELVYREPGVEWLLGRCVELAAKNPGVRWVLDDHGPAASFADEMKRAGLRPLMTTTSDLADATEQFIDSVRAGEYQHGPDELVETAILGVKARVVGDGRIVIGRKTSAVDITAVEVLVLAAWVAENKKKANSRVIALT